MCIVTKPGRPQTNEDLRGELETTEQIGIAGGRGKTLLPNIVSLLKSKDAAAAATDGCVMPTEQVVGNNNAGLVGGETTKTTKETGDIVEFQCPQARAASESAAVEITGELATGRPTENVALPAVVSMSTMTASNNGLAPGSIMNIISSTHTISGSSFSLVETASESDIIQQKKKKSSGKKKKKRAMMVDHTYHEHMNDLPPGDAIGSKKSGKSSGVTTRSSVANRQGANVEQRQFRVRARGGVQHPFPTKLHQVLEDMEKNGHENIMGWMPHGRSFMVKDPKEFVKDYMPTYFNQHKLASFQRQLNLYGFKRLTGEGPDRGSYYHGKSLFCLRCSNVLNLFLSFPLVSPFLSIPTITPQSSFSVVNHTWAIRLSESGSRAPGSVRRQTLMASPTSIGCHTVIATAGSPLILGHIPSQSLLPLFLKKKPPRSLQAAMATRTYMYQPRIKWKLLLVVQNPSRLLWRDPRLSFHRRYLHLLARLPCLRIPCQI